MRIKEYDNLIKIVFVGNSAVGKSSLLMRFADNQFNQNYLATIGVDFRFKSLQIDGKTVKLQIWDTAGQQKFRTITNTYYKSAQGIILVYDITNKDSLNDIRKYWIGQIQSYADKGTILILIGNKNDLDHQRVITKQEGQNFAKQNNMIFFQTSAKTSDNVKLAFQQITRTLLKNGGDLIKPKSININDKKTKNSYTGCNC